MNFDWSKIKKEQKQVLILVVMWLIGGLFALYQFVLRPFMQDAGGSAGDLEELHSKILKAQVAMDGESRVRTEFREVIAEINDVRDTFIVPRENPLTWATEHVYLSSRLVGLDIQSVSEVAQLSPAWENAIKAERMFRPYTVRIVTEATYPQVIAFAAALEKSNPYMAVTSVGVVGQDQDRQKHVVSFIVEFPMWGRPPKFEVATLGQRADE